MMIYRQGDILIKKINKIPEKAKKVNHRILAHGEATGHVHAVQDGELFDMDGILFLNLAIETELTHQEHNTIQLPAGNYEVIRQREYTPERIKYVQD